MASAQTLYFLQIYCLQLVVTLNMDTWLIIYQNMKKTTFIEDWTINDNRIIECLFERSDLQKSLIEKNPVSSKAAQQIVSRIKSTPNFKDSELGQLLKMKYD